MGMVSDEGSNSPSGDEYEEEGNNYEEEEEDVDEEVAWAASSTIHSSTIHVAATTAIPRTSASAAEVTINLTDDVIQNIASVSAAAAPYPNVIADTQLDMILIRPN
jgi:hypothetical protein